MTNKPMLSVERELLELVTDNKHIDKESICIRRWEALCKLRAILNKPAAQQQGEPVACMPVDRCYDVRAKMIIAFNEAKKAGGDLDDALDAAYKSALRYSPNPMTAEQPAPVAVVLPFAEKIISKLRRFDECASDGQGVDIGRHWFDLLAQLGLLNRVQRSPALWEMTQQGEDALEATRLNTPQ